MALVSTWAMEVLFVDPWIRVGLTQPMNHLLHASMCAGLSPFSVPGLLLVQQPVPIKPQCPMPSESPLPGTVS